MLLFYYLKKDVPIEMKDSSTKITVLSSLFHCEQYLETFLGYVAKLDNQNRVELLLLHNAPTEAELQIINKWLPKLPFVKHVIILEREKLYETWNRGISLAEGEYLTIWNVDDIRLPHSVLDEAAMLDTHPEADLTYGDMYFMYQYPIYTEKLCVYADFQKTPKLFFREHNIGCFPMWRKSIHEKIGYFDEQYCLVADFDFQIRAARCCQLVKTPQILGYYLEDVPQKLSCNRALQDIERHSLYLRYGAFDLFNWFMFFKVRKKIDLCHVLRGSQRIALAITFPCFDAFRRRSPWLILAGVWRQPRNFLAYLKHHVWKYRKKGH